MTAPAKYVWGSHYQVRACRRCGSAFKVPRYSVRWHCSTMCATNDLREQRARQREVLLEREWDRIEAMRCTPLHELYPGMIEVCERVQIWRPSYAAWMEARR